MAEAVLGTKYKWLVIYTRFSGKIQLLFKTEACRSQLTRAGAIGYGAFGHGQDGRNPVRVTEVK